MIHVAIMRKSWGLTEKILSGEKSIESRWSLKRTAPWGRVGAGDSVYFKNSGEPVTIRTRVRKVSSFSDLTPEAVRSILAQYGKRDGIRPGELDRFFSLFKDKRYCTLVFLERPASVPPFNVSKKGFGARSAWLTAASLARIRA